MDGGLIRNFDGEEPGYAGVVDAESLKLAIRKAVVTRSPSQPWEWPKVPFLADDNDTAGTPGGSGDDDAGSTGKADD